MAAGFGDNNATQTRPEISGQDKHEERCRYFRESSSVTLPMALKLKCRTRQPGCLIDIINTSWLLTELGEYVVWRGGEIVAVIRNALLGVSAICTGAIWVF